MTHDIDRCADEIECSICRARLCACQMEWRDGEAICCDCIEKEAERAKENPDGN